MSEASSIISVVHRRDPHFVDSPASTANNRSLIEHGAARLFADDFTKSEKCGNQIFFLFFSLFSIPRPESRSISMQTIYSFRVFFCNFSRKNFLRIHPSSGGVLSLGLHAHTLCKRISSLPGRRAPGFASTRAGCLRIEKQFSRWQDLFVFEGSSYLAFIFHVELCKGRAKGG